MKLSKPIEIFVILLPLLLLGNKFGKSGILPIKSEIMDGFYVQGV